MMSLTQTSATLYAAHTGYLVLGVGRTERAALRDALRYDADPDMCDTCEITPKAAAYVRGGGDCRALRLRRTADGLDCLALRGEG